MSTVNDLKSNISRFRYNPASIQQAVLEHLESITEGTIDIVDPTNPFVFCLESSAVNTAAFMVENEVNTRKQYPSIAQTPEDVYIHMSDVDFVDRFAVPAKTKFTIVANKEELINSMVYDIATNSRKIIIPRNTYFTVNDVVFSMEYPVEIREQSHGGLQVVYNTDKISPLMDLTSNIIKWEVRKISPNTVDEWIYIEVDVIQVKVETYEEEVTQALGFNRSYLFNDQFHYARVWNKSNNTNGEWVEIYTTHTDQAYDPTKATAVLKVINNELSVFIPRIYLTTNKVSGSIRVDLYETKGSINMILENYKTDAFEARWYDIADEDLSAFSAPLSTLRTLFVYSAEPVNGGRSSITFEQLRERVIYNAVGPQELPITNVQLETSLSNNGYTLVRDVDVVTNRIFLASRPMPIPFDEKLITAGNSSIETFIESMAKLQLHGFIRSNGERLTIPSNTLFLNKNGIISLVSELDIVDLNSLNNENFVKTVNNNRYLYNPFHYVLDSEASEFELRCYYLDSPVIKSLNFVDQNDSTSLQMNTEIFDIEITNSGFRVAVRVKRNLLATQIPLSNINAQLSFIPDNGVRCSVNATKRLDVDNNLIFDFLLESNFDVDKNNNLIFNNFNFFDEDERTVLSNLRQKFDLVISTTDTQPTWIRTTIDNFINYVTVPPLSIGINHEVLDIEFGKTLKNLWRRSRSVVSSSPYRTHAVDVPLVYEEDLYFTDPSTGSKIKVNSETGGLEFNIIKQKGEPVIDSNNRVVYKHRAGDVLLDELGNPIPENPSNIVRQLDLFFVDGNYLLANDTSSETYRKQMVDSVVNWVVNELGGLNNRTLEQTSIYFYPKTNLGSIKVLVDQSQVTNIDANQTFSVQIYVNKLVFDNLELRKYLTNSTIKTLDSLMGEKVISNSKIISRLKDVYGDDVISVAVQGLGGKTVAETITILNDGDKCSIGKKLQALPNDTRIVIEDININFIEHQLED